MNRYEILNANAKALDSLGTRAAAIATAKDMPEAETVLDLETGSIVWSRSGATSQRVRSLD